ncbi:MAG TPA: type II CAAX endopeptidase family protein [Kofleriaceae bacterium]|nr:type II CAAX endopeptidase family protein [Kofleriaceae bacterium]
MYHASRAPAVEPIVAVAIVLAAMATYLVAPLLVPSELALIAAQAAIALVPVAFVFALHRARTLETLGLRGARPRYLLAAALIGATAWYVNTFLVALLPVPERGARMLEELVERPSLVRALATFALVPAVCEEILFRGVLARSLGRHLRLVPAALISALVFAAYHHSLIQSLPTLTLGVLLGLIAIRADSVLPTIVAHALNNAAAIAMSRAELPEVAAWFGSHPLLALVGCAGATALGTAIAVRGGS